MTTYVSPNQSWNNSLADDASFRQMCQWIHDAIVGCGIVDTNDTGAANLSTITRGTNANSVRGVRMYRFNDSRQGVDPIFLRISYMTSGNYQNPPMLAIQVGQGTNGSLTLTGQTGQAYWCGGPNSSFVTNPFTAQNYSCHTEGFFALHLGRHMNSNVSSQAFNYHNYILARTRDSNYNFDGAGVMQLTDNNIAFAVPTAQYIRFASPAATGVGTTQLAIVPGIPADTALLNGDKQLYPHFFYEPGVKIVPSWASFTVKGSEFGVNPTTFSAAPLNGVSRTFIFFGSTAAMYGDSNGDTSFRVAHLWE